MKRVMPALAVAWQVDLNANERIRVVDLQACLPRAHHAVSALP
jgi:hypothetical protein